MGARPDLDLSDILPAYREFLGDYESTASINFVKPTAPESEEYVEQSLGWGPSVQRSEPPLSTLLPLRIGNGPATCSTRTTLVSTVPAFSWDVNGYYGTLGIPFPYVNATSGVLSKGYVANGGQQSPRATYYLKQLLNKAVRAIYDAHPLGEQYLDDEYVQEAIKASAAEEAGRRSQTGSYTRAESVMDEWGYVYHEDDAPGVDNQRTNYKDGSTPEISHYEPIEWTYSYWLWNSFVTDTTRLEQWQALLVSALSGQKPVDLAVGILGKQPHPYAVREVDGYQVVFLNENQEPTAELAAQAADALMNDLRHLA